MEKTKRLQLHDILCSIIESRNVYFQPPESVKMRYPAIVYELNNVNNRFADDQVYLSKRGYMVTVIDKDPDSPIVGRVAALPTCRFSRHYQKDNLNHSVFTIFY